VKIQRRRNSKASIVGTPSPWWFAGPNVASSHRLARHNFTYPSAAKLLRNRHSTHFFRDDGESRGDYGVAQGHASRVSTPRVFLRDRISAEATGNSSPGIATGRGPHVLPLQAHARTSGNDPTQYRWDLARYMAIYQARFNRYLEGQSNKNQTCQSLGCRSGRR